MNIVDAIIIICLILGIMGGMRRGLFKQLAFLIGILACVYFAFILKTDVSTYMYKHLPFFNFGGLFKGVTALNILLYELMAFLALFTLFYVVLLVILKITGILEKVFNGTIILGFFSKIGGAILGLVEGYLIVFILLFILKQPFLGINGLDKSKFTGIILNSTPVLSSSIKNMDDAIEEITDLAQEYKYKKKDEFNKETIELLVKYNIITEENIEILKKRGKLK